MSHVAGPKISGRHTTLIDAALDVVEAVNSLDCVTKIVLGIIEQAYGLPVEKRIMIVIIPAGIQVKIRGPKTIQALFIYTNDRLRTCKSVIAAFKKKAKRVSVKYR